MGKGNKENVKKPVWKRWWFWAGVIILVIIIANSGKGNDSKSSGNNGGSTVQNQPANTEYKVGDTIQLKNHSILVNSVNKNYKSGNQFDKPQDSNNSFVVVDVTVTNTGNDDLSVNDFGFKLEDETGTQRNTTFGGLADGKLQSVTLSKGGKTSGKIVFEAKTGSATLKLHYQGGIFGGEEVIVNL